jgi:hypothetical protein
MRVLRRMLSRSRRFRTDAMAGFVVVVLLLTLGMTLALQRIEHATTRQLAHVQSEEYEITLVERLRWSGEGLRLGWTFTLPSATAAVRESRRVRG